MNCDDIVEQVADAQAACSPICIRGGGSKSFIGRQVQGESLDVSTYRGVIDYDPSELVVTVRCGTPLVEIESMLAEQGQMLPFEAPEFTLGATIGGVVASGLSGPRRPWSGSVRDFVLGVRCVTGRGELLGFGGRVIKNVAGYDVSRLMVGALGTLGVVVEVSFKVLPLPGIETTRVFEFDEARAIEFLASVGLTPLPLSASCYHDGRLYVRLSGSESGVKTARELIGGDSMTGTDDFWRSLRNQTHAFFRDAAPLWRVSLAPATPPLGLAGETLIEWGGALRWVRGQPGDTREQSIPAEFSANATLFRNGDRTSDVYPMPDPVTWRLYTRLKESFDPARILNPGRLYRDL